jgi:hypothetical protein
MMTLGLFLMMQAAAGGVSPELLAVKNVYILPMGNGFDQFLANAVSRKGVLQVVADPAKADVIFTDRLGKGFEKAMAELYPEPKAVEAVKPAKEEEEEDKPAAFDVKNLAVERQSTFGRGKGTYFLVNRATKNVIWSVYEKPAARRPDDLADSAWDVAGALAKALGQVAKGQK